MEVTDGCRCAPWLVRGTASHRNPFLDLDLETETSSALVIQDVVCVRQTSKKVKGQRVVTRSRDELVAQLWVDAKIFRKPTITKKMIEVPDMK